MKRNEKNKTEKVSLMAKIKSAPKVQCYLLLSPQIIGFLVFTIYPIIWVFSKAWFYYDRIPADTHYVGFHNFISLFTNDASYWRSWMVTFQFALCKIPIEIPLALVLAVLLSKKLKGSNFFRSVYFMPSIISVMIVGVMFTNLFDFFGVLNALLMKAGIIQKQIDWFAHTETSFVALIAGSVWSTFGINVLYFTAALNNIPKEVYESADIDGATGVKKFFHITIPMIAPVFQTILLLAINGTLQTGEYIISMTNGAPAGSTLTVGAYIINSFVPGFATGKINIGYGCALSLVTSIIYGMIAMVYMKLSKKLSNVY